MSERTVYDYVAVIGVDGMGNFNKDAATPNIDKIFENGAQNFYGYSMLPTVSAQNWGGMLLGASPAVHTLTNGYISQFEYNNDKLPSVFRRIREVYPDAFLASYVNWNPINHGIVEHNMGVELGTDGNDEVLTDKILPAVMKKPKFLFVQFDNVDGAGHRNDYGSEAHLDQISLTDGYIGKIYEAYEKAGIIEDTLFIVTADHGGYNRSHGGFTVGEKFVYIGAKGKGVPKGEIGFYRTKDISSIVLYALGISFPEFDEFGYSGQVPDGIFPETKGSYKLIESEANIPEPLPTPSIDSEKGLYSYIDKEKLKLALFFNDSLKDETGRNTEFNEFGLVKFYRQGIYDSRAEFGATGYVCYPQLKIGDKGFTFSAWIWKQEITSLVSLFGNLNLSDRPNGAGFQILQRTDDVLILMFGSGKETEFVAPLPEGVSEGWVHIMVSVDTEKGFVQHYLNFRPTTSGYFDTDIFKDFNGGIFVVGSDTSHKKVEQLFYIDDLFIIDGVITENEVNNLKNYYNL